MQKPFCPGQDRGGKYLSQRNIHIGNTVLKIRFPASVMQRMEHHLHAGLIIIPASYDDMPGLIQGVNDMLLDALVFAVIQGVNPDGLPEYLLKIRPDIRFWKCNDGKTGLIPGHILVHDLPGFIGIRDGQLLLMSIQGQGGFLIDWCESCLSECLHQGRSCAPGSQLLKLLIGSLQDRKPAFLKTIAHIQGAVIAVVIIILPVGRSPIITAFPPRPAVHGLHCRPVENRFQAHGAEILHCLPYHPLKTQLVFHHHCLFLRQVPAHDLKPFAVALGICVRHPVNGFLGQAVHKGCHL